MPWGEPEWEMDIAFRRMRRKFEFKEDTAEHYRQKIREFYEGKEMDKRAVHLIKDKFPEYWHRKYVMAYELWKGRLLRRVWRDRRSGRIITWDITFEDIDRVYGQMHKLEVYRVGRDLKPFPKKTEQKKLMRPDGEPRY